MIARFPLETDRAEHFAARTPLLIATRAGNMELCEVCISSDLLQCFPFEHARSITKLIFWQTHKLGVISMANQATPP